MEGGNELGKEEMNYNGGNGLWKDGMDHGKEGMDYGEIEF